MFHKTLSLTNQTSAVTNVVHDSDPNEQTSVDTTKTNPGITPSSTTAAPDKVPYVGFTTATGETTRNYKGSKRPPDIPGIILQTFSQKAQAHSWELLENRFWLAVKGARRRCCSYTSWYDGG